MTSGLPNAGCSLLILAAGPQFVPPAERVVTFDQDGALWFEQPMYAQLVFALDRVKDVVKAQPALANEAPFKAAAVRQPQGRQAGRHQHGHWASAAGSLRQLRRRPADDRVDDRRPGPAAGQRHRHVGTSTQALYDEAKKQGWPVISIENDWKRVFAFE